jgi:RecQ-mediated genome instability protein 1
VENMQNLKDKVEEQLLKSDLHLSTLHNTGLDPRISQFTGVLQGAPTLVQILAITEIGVSALQLEQVRVAREERMRDGEGNVEGDEDGDVEIEGEGPMPKYPRGQLHFRLSDGLTNFEATEYRRLPELVLGNTPLGFKVCFFAI